MLFAKPASISTLPANLRASQAHLENGSGWDDFPMVSKPLFNTLNGSI